MNDSEYTWILMCAVLFGGCINGEPGLETLSVPMLVLFGFAFGGVLWIAVRRHDAVAIMLVVSAVLFFGVACVTPDPPPGPGTQSEMHTAILGRVLGEWAFDPRLPPVPRGCYDELYHVRVWVGNGEAESAFCGGPMCDGTISPCLAGCYRRWCPDVLSEPQPGIVLAQDDPRIMAHEAVHFATDCVLNDLGTYHDNPGVWGNTEDRLEGRVKIWATERFQ